MAVVTATCSTAPEAGTTTAAPVATPTTQVVTRTSTTAAVAVATTIPTATTAPTNAVPPTLLTDNDDWDAVWTSMMEVRDWVAEHPDQRDVLFEVFSDDCPCLEEEFLIVDGLAELGLVAEMSGVEILALREVARPRDDRVILGIETYRPPFVFLSSDGTVYQDDLGDWTEILAVSLSKVDGRWLIQSLEVTERILGS